MALNNRELLSPYCVTATYTAQRIPQFVGNKLIEALPPSMSDEELFQLLSQQPPFQAEQRNWATHERMYMLMELKNFLVPLSRHFELARALDSMLRSGYVGRMPRTPEHNDVYKAIHENEVARRSFAQSARIHTPQLSTSLIGMSGLGKTTVVKRWCAHIAPVIYHEDFHVYQVPYLHVEMPSDGASIKGLAKGILQKLDELIPGAKYYENYAMKARPGADALMRSVARVMHRHFVGILICDEVQNLVNSHKGQQTVMTELVSACNDLGVPILFIGTTKAMKILSLDFRQARRSCGHGIKPWQRLSSRGGDGAINEWTELIQVIWQNQWLRRPVELTDELSDTLYRYSQGIIDVALTLFASAQARAMLDGSERLTPQLIRRVYIEELGTLHSAIDALHRNDIDAISRFDDISSELELSRVIEDMPGRARALSSSLHQVTSGHQSYIPTLTNAMVALGLTEADALAAAKSTIKSNQERLLIEGAAEALSHVKRPRKLRPAKVAESDAPGSSYDDRPNDYRRASEAARKDGRSVLHHMHAMGLIQPLHTIIQVN